MTKFRLFVALLPIIILVFYIYNRDKEKPGTNEIITEGIILGHTTSICIALYIYTIW